MELSVYSSRDASTSRATHVRINIDGSVHVGLGVVLDLDAVGIASVPELEDLSQLIRTDVGLHHLTHLESKFVGFLTGHETVAVHLVIQVLADKDKARFSRLIFLPLDIGESTTEHHAWGEKFRGL